MKKIFLLAIALLAVLACLMCSCDTSEEHEHTPVKVQPIASTCTVPGKTVGLVCGECGEVIKAQEDRALAPHEKAVDSAVAPTCTEVGKTEGMHCSECGLVLEEQNTIPMIEHDLGEATCTSPATCRVCGFESCDPLGHIAVTLEAVGSTCTSDGHGEVRICDRCGEILSDGGIIAATGHKEESVDAKAPTCTEKGSKEGVKCSVCGLIISGCEPTDAKGHTEVISPAVLPVDGKGGLTEGISCSDCGEIIVEAVDPLRYLTRTGYEYLGTLPKGKAMQELYDRLWVQAIAAHMNRSLDYGSSVVSVNIEDLGLTDREAMLAVYTAYIENKPLCYWMAGASGDSKSVFIPFRDEYRNGEQRYEYNLELYRAVQSISSDSDNAFDKTKDYHDYICNNIRYAYDESGKPLMTNWAHNSLGYTLYGEAVCEGYSSIFSLVLNYNGIPCIDVHGKAGGVGHAWNLAQMEDGNWYWFDMTWNDTDNKLGNGSEFEHTYFCVNDTQTVIARNTFMTSHTPNQYMYELPARPDTIYRLNAAQILELAYDLPTNYRLLCGESFTLTGKIIEINTAYSQQYKNVTVTIVVEGHEDKPMKCYRLSGEGADKLTVGDVITVTGEIINYQGNTVEFAQGCTFVLAE